MGKIRAAFDTSHYGGRVAKSVRVITNDPAAAGLALTLSAEIVRAIAVSPSDTVTFAGRPEQIAPRELILSATDAKPFEVTGLDVDTRLDARIAPAPGEPAAKPVARELPAPLAAGSSRYLLTVAAKPDAPAGRGMAAVIVKTSHPKAASVPVRVSLAVVGPIAVTPERVVLQPQATSQHVKLLRPDGPPLAILGVTSSDPDVTATTTAVREGREYDVAITFGGAVHRPVNARVTLRTNEPRQREILILVLGQT